MAQEDIMSNPNEAAPTAPANPQKEGAPVIPAVTPTAPAAPAPAAAPVDPVAESAQILADQGVDSLKAAIDKLPYPSRIERILAMDEKQLTELERQFKAKRQAGMPQAPAPAPASAPAEPGAPVPDDTEETITLKRSELGTYATKDRTLKDSILELIKGKKSADDVIEFHKTKRIPAMEKAGQQLALENQRLKTQVDELQKKVPAAPAAPAAGDIVVPPLPSSEDVDFFDPAAKKKYLDGVAAHTEALEKKHLAEVEALRNPKPAPAPTAPAAAPQEDPVQREYNEIDMLQSNPETAGIFKTKKPVAEVEKEYVAFVDNLAKINGIKEIYDAAGRFMPAVSTLINQYFDQNSADGKTLRTVMDAVKAMPPEDIQSLFRIYNVRKVRNTYRKPNPVTHAVEPLPYEEAFALDRKLHPELYTTSSTPTPQQQANGDQDAINRGLEHRQQFAPEVPSQLAVPITAHDDVSVEEFFRLMKKPLEEFNEGEETKLRKLMKTYAQMGDDEINSYFITKKKK